MESGIDIGIFNGLRTGKPLQKILENCGNIQIRPYLATFLRKLCLPNGDDHDETAKKYLRSKILAIPDSAEVVPLLTVDFKKLGAEIKKDLEHKKKTLNIDGRLPESQQNASSVIDEGEPIEKFRIVLTELLASQLLVDQNKVGSNSGKLEYELFDNPSLETRTLDILVVSMAEFPNLLDLPSVVSVLLHYKGGSRLALQLIANYPHQWQKVLESRISFSCPERHQFLNSQNIRLITSLLQLQPKASLEVLEILTSDRKNPILTLMLVASEPDEETFILLLSNLLVAARSGDGANQDWLSSFIFGVQKKHQKLPQPVTEILKRLGLVLKGMIDSKDMDFLPQNSLEKASSALRLIVALKTVWHVKFTSEELAVFLEIACSKVKPSVEAKEFLTLCVASILACPSLIHSAGGGASPEAESKFLDWVNWLLSVEPSFERLESQTRGSGFGELLLLAAMQFHANHLHQISGLLAQTIGFKISPPIRQLQRLKTLFTLDLFTEQRVAERAAQVPVTQSLSNETSGYLPIHCVLQLLNLRAFAKHKISIADWILAQLKECAVPVHKSVPELLEAYARSCIHPLCRAQTDPQSRQGFQTVQNKPLDERKLIDIFDGDPFDNSKLVSRVLALYYLLSYEDVWMTEAKKIRMEIFTAPILFHTGEFLKYLWMQPDGRISANNGNRRNGNKKGAAGRVVDIYSGKLWEKIHLRQLIRSIHLDGRNFEAVYAPIIRNIAEQFPYILDSDPRQFKLNDNEPDPMNEERKFTEKLTPERMKSALSNAKSSPGTAMEVVKTALSLGMEEKIKLMNGFLESFPVLLNPEIPRLLMELCTRLWTQLEVVFLRRLYCKTTAVLTGQSSLTQESIMKDPLILLRCDQRVFRSPMILSLVLKMIKFCLLASKKFLDRELLTGGGDAGLDGEREELLSALISAQESAIVQMLLEVCLPNEGELADPCQLSQLREVQCLICSMIHEMFIANPILGKLVHFQGYPKELIPLTVKGIPSMHICLSFFPELMSQPSHDTRKFAIELLSHLCGQFAIPKALKCARLAVDVSNTILMVSPTNISLSFIEEVKPALLRMAKIFPPLTADVYSLLLQTASIERSSYMVRCGLGKDETSPKAKRRKLGISLS